jgi:hypothetical protein
VNIFRIHDSLWGCYDDGSGGSSLEYQDKSYGIDSKKDYCCTVLPNLWLSSFRLSDVHATSEASDRVVAETECNLWTTNNMSLSNYATYQIQSARQRRQIHRVTWIIGKLSPSSPSDHRRCLKGYVNTTRNSSGQIDSANIYSFYHGAQIKLYGYVKRHDGADFERMDKSFVGRDISTDHFIF